MNKKYGKKTPLTVNHGKVHECLGMTIDYSTPGEVKISMDDYVDTILELIPDDMKGGVANSPAGDNLFRVNPNETKLDEPKKDLFHALTARLLYLGKRVRQELQTAVSFLTTRVQAPDTDDYKKHSRVIQYLQKDPHLPLTLRADNLRLAKWWVDASLHFAVHPNMRSHTGGNGSLGKGSFYATSTTQKLNTRSSTEAELVGVDDVMSMILWSSLFLEAQGYKMEPATLYQDNQSTMLLAKNGRRSSSKRTRHLNIRYYFVKDCIDQNEIALEHCPTKEMIADILTKPLQGAAFLKLRQQLLNLPNTLGNSQE